MSKCSLERSSTLRACIEKPSDDFIVEYKSQRRSSKKAIHYELTSRSRPYTARPRALPAATLRPLERKKRIKSKHLPSNDMAACSKDKIPVHWAPDSKARCRSLPKEFQWASGTSVTTGSVVKHDSEQDSPSRSTSITTLQLPPMYLKGRPCPNRTFTPCTWPPFSLHRSQLFNVSSQTGSQARGVTSHSLVLVWVYVRDYHLGVVWMGF
ncbi:hypothetical protein NXS19_009063 [Fusarium pseudograminearum]|nr:hypothetical protein NXS19_009063 [Fusarium pseudograminearum]